MPQPPASEGNPYITIGHVDLGDEEPSNGLQEGDMVYHEKYGIGHVIKSSVNGVTRVQFHGEGGTDND